MGLAVIVFGLTSLFHNLIKDRCGILYVNLLMVTLIFRELELATVP
jgi:hypothetical protein